MLLFSIQLSTQDSNINNIFFVNVQKIFYHFVYWIYVHFHVFTKKNLQYNKLSKHFIILRIFINDGFLKGETIISSIYHLVGVNDY